MSAKIMKVDYCYEEDDIPTKPPFACMTCGSKDITILGHDYRDKSRECIELWHCVSCGQEWEEVYKFEKTVVLPRM